MMKKVLRRTYAGIYKAARRILMRFGVGRFKIVKKVNYALLKPLREKTTVVEGHKMYLDEKDSLNLGVNGVFEVFETQLVKEHISKGDVIVDIGANIGYYSLLFAKLSGSKGKVYAFEPDPTNFSLLKKNVRINNYSNIDMINKAVSDRNENLKLYLCDENKGDHRTYDSGDGRDAVDIEAVKLDEFLKGKKVNFIKIDIQGAEGKAMLGMEGILKKSSKIKIITEFWPVGLKRGGYPAEKYLQIFAKNKFKFYNIDEGKRKLVPTTKSKLLKEYTVKKNNFTNLLLVKG